MTKPALGATRAWELPLGGVTEEVGELGEDELEVLVDAVGPDEDIRCSGVPLGTFAFRTTFSLSSRKRRDNWSR